MPPGRATQVVATPSSTTAPAARRRHLAPWWPAGVGILGTLPFITRRVGDPDYWWHTLTGQLIVHQHAVVRSDLYTYTVFGQPWTDHEYGSQLILYGLTRAGGLLAVSAFFAVVVWAGFWLLLARMRALDVAPAVAGAALVLGAGAGFFMWGPSPQMFDFLFLALELTLVERFLAGPTRGLWSMPLVVLVWANLHGGFVFAFVVLGVLVVTLALRCALLGGRTWELRLLREAALITAACAVATLITPWGPSLYAYVWQTQFSSQLSGFIAEWQSPDFHLAAVAGFLIMLIAVLIGFGLRRPRLFDTLLVVVATVLALHAVRFTVVFVALVTPVVAWQWSAAWSVMLQRAARLRMVSSGGPAPVRGVAVTAIGVAAVAVSISTLRGQAASTTANYPVAAADWLAAHPTVGTRVFNQFDWGGYLAYRFYPDPDRRPFIYGEAELMGDRLLAEYADVNQLRGNWERVLAENGVDYVVFARGKPLDTALRDSSSWQLVHTDRLADVFVLKNTAAQLRAPLR